MNGKIIPILALLLSMLLLPGCQVERSIIKGLPLEASEADTKVVSVTGESKKFGLGKLTARQHSKLVHRARMSGRNSHTLQANQKFQNESIRVYSKHFFIFRMSRAESQMEVWQANP